jgi:hypothetical protein
MAEHKKYRPSFSIGREHDELLRIIIKRTRRTMTEEIRVMIEDRAKAIGLDVDVLLSPKAEAVPSHATA